MANTRPKIQAATFAMRADEGFLAKLERLRQLLPDEASKSDAVRIAIDEALEKRERERWRA